MSITRIIWIHAGPFAYQEIRLNGPTAFTGRHPQGNEAVRQAIHFLFDSHAVPDVSLQWLRQPDARLVYEVAGGAGMFLVVALPGETQPSYYLLNGDYERDLLIGPKQTVRSESQLLAEMKQRGLGHSERLADAPALWQQLDPGPHEGKKRRYAWFPAAYLPTYRRLMTLSQQPSYGTQADLRHLLCGNESDGLDLAPLRQDLQQLARHQGDIDFLTQHQDQLDQLIETAQRYQLTQEALDQQLKALAPQASQLNLLTERSAAHLTHAQRALRDAQATHQQRLAALAHEIDLTLRQIGGIESRLEQGQTLADYYQHQDLSAWQAAHQHLSSQPVLPSAPASATPLPHPADLALREAKQTHQTRLAELAPALAQAQACVTARQQDLVNLSGQPDRPSLLSDDILAARETFARLQAELMRHEARQQHLEQQRQQAQQALDTQQADAATAHQANLDQLEAQLDTTQKRLQQSSQSLMAWLDGRYPDWQETIGKVVREEVLLHPYLSPSVERLNDLLFGVQLDLSELETPLIGSGRLQAELVRQTDAIERARQEGLAAQQTWIKQQQNLDKRFRQKLSTHTREGQQLRYRVEQAELHEKRLRHQWRDRQQALQQRLAQQRLTLAYQLEADQAALASLQAQREALDADWEAAWRRWEAAHRAVPSPQGAVALPAPEEGAAWLALATQWQQYQHDWQAWIAPMAGWRDALAWRRALLMRLRGDHARQVDTWPQWAQRQQTAIELATAEQQRLTQAADTWAQLRTQGEALAQDGPKPAEGLATDLAAQIEKASQRLASLRQQEANLRTQARAIAAGLSVNNVLRLPVELASVQDCLALADQLAPYLGGDRWQQVQQELAGRYAPWLSRLSGQLGGLDRDRSQQSRVARLNQYLQGVPAPAGYAAIRVRLMPGEQPLLRAMLDVRAFTAAQGPALGDHSLFSQGGDGAVDGEAMALLMRLHDTLARWPGERMAWAETFGLHIEVRQVGTESWLPWQPWAEADSDARATWQSLLLATWAALDVSAGAPLPLGATSQHAAEDLRTWLALAKAGGLTPVFPSLPSDLTDDMAMIYHWQWDAEREGLVGLPLMVPMHQP
jgi:hypothetical protein